VKAPAPGGDRGTSEQRSKSTALSSKKPALDEATLERVSTADRRWFEQHPRARWRIRPTEPGEWPDDVQGYGWTAVRTFSVGRVRIPLAGSPPPGLTDRGIDRLMDEIVPPQTRLLIGELKAMEAGR
jgi:hypothetical protein